MKCSAGENQGEKRAFLSLEEAGLVELSGLSTHERFLCRLTVTLLGPLFFRINKEWFFSFFAV